MTSEINKMETDNVKHGDESRTLHGTNFPTLTSNHDGLLSRYVGESSEFMETKQISASGAAGTGQEHILIISCLLCNNYYHHQDRSEESFQTDYDAAKLDIQKYIQEEIRNSSVVKGDQGLLEYIIRGVEENIGEGLLPFCNSCFLEIKHLQEVHARLKLMQNEVHLLQEKLIQEFQATYSRRFSDIKVEGPEELTNLIDCCVAEQDMESDFDVSLFTNSYGAFPDLCDSDVGRTSNSNSVTKAEAKFDASISANPVRACSVVLERLKLAHLAPVEKRKLRKLKRGRHRKTRIPRQARNTHRGQPKGKQRKLVQKDVNESKKSSRTYPCGICKKEFETHRSQQLHQHCHFNGDNPMSDKKHYYCCFCTRSFICRGNFIKHLEQEHGDNEQLANGGAINFYYCDSTDCDQCFGSKVLLEEHIKTSHTPSWSCSSCEMPFAVEENFTKHQELVHGKEEGKVNCPFCHLIFDSERDLAPHQVVHEIRFPTQKFACHICGVSYDTPSRLNSHKSRQHKFQQETSDEVTINESAERTRGQLDTTLAIQPIRQGKFTIFPCDECGKKFGCRSALKAHSYEHIPNHPGFPCPTCNTVFKTPAQLSRHQINVHRRPKCEFCQKEVWSITVLREHQFHNHPNEYLADKPFHCNICFRNYTTEGELDTHMVVHENSKCKICYMQCTNARGLKIHERAHFIDRSTLTAEPSRSVRNDERRLNECISCKESFGSEVELKKHYLEMHEDVVGENGRDLMFPRATKPSSRMRKRICPESGSQAQQRLRRRWGRWSAHVAPNREESHSNHESNSSSLTDRVECDICGRSYTMISSLNLHKRLKHNYHNIEIVHPPRPPRPTGRPRRQVGDVLNGSRRKISAPQHAAEENRRICEICGSSQTNSGFYKHQKLHDANYRQQLKEKRTEKCVYCDKIFTLSISHRRHLIKDHPEQHLLNHPYFCRICCYTFLTEGDLNTHLADSHFKCQYCSRQFSTKLRADEHENIHTGNRPYQCLECGKTFKGHSMFAMHKKLHKPDRPFECTFCSNVGKKTARFVLQGELNKHIRRSHPNELHNLKKVSHFPKHPKSQK